MGAQPSGALLRDGIPGNDSEGHPICWCSCGCQKPRPPHWDRCPDCVNGKHLAAPQPAEPLPTPADLRGLWRKADAEPLDVERLARDVLP